MPSCLWIQLDFRNIIFSFFFLFFPRFTTPALQVIQEFNRIIRDFCPNLMVWCWWKPMKILNFRPIYMKILKFGEAIWKSMESMGHPKKSKLLSVFLSKSYWFPAAWGSCTAFWHRIRKPPAAVRGAVRMRTFRPRWSRSLERAEVFWSRTFGQD